MHTRVQDVSCRPGDHSYPRHENCCTPDDTGLSSDHQGRHAPTQLQWPQNEPSKPVYFRKSSGKRMYCICLLPTRATAMSS